MSISYTSNNITFNDVKQTSMGWGALMGRTANGDFSDAEDDGVEPFVNAVEIDWNGAKLGTTTINTTGQLLSYISEVA